MHYYIALQCITLHYITLHCITLHCITLHYTALHCITPYYIALHCITLQYIALHCIHCITIYYFALNCIHYFIIHYITSHYIVLYSITLYYISNAIYIQLQSNVMQYCILFLGGGIKQKNLFRRLSLNFDWDNYMKEHYCTTLQNVGFLPIMILSWFFTNLNRNIQQSQQCSLFK